VEAENSVGFHAPQEAGRVLGNAINYARMGQIAVRGGNPGMPNSGLPSRQQGAGTTGGNTPAASRGPSGAAPGAQH